MHHRDGDTLGIYFQFAVQTWYRVRLTQNGQQFEGWFPENIQWKYLYLDSSDGDIILYHDFTAYFLMPDPVNSEQSFYVDNWNILDDLEIGEAGARKPAAQYGLPYIDAGGEACPATLLQTRLNGAPRARVAIDALNLRSLPTTASQPIAGTAWESPVATSSLGNAAPSRAPSAMVRSEPRTQPAKVAQNAGRTPVSLGM